MQVTINTSNNPVLSSQQIKNIFIFNEVPNGLINGINAVFTSNNLFIPETLEVYINGLRQVITNDYITTGYNTITLSNSLEITDLISINYIKI